MATDWSARDEALECFEKLLKLAKRNNDDDKEMLQQAVNALRRSRDHTAIQNKLKALTEALDFYSKPDNWARKDHYSTPSQDFPAWTEASKCMNDGGALARSALGKSGG